MSVYTTVDSAQLAQFLRRYDLGKATSFTPIAAGITNTNYSLDTEQGRFVLTLYEHHSDDELDYILGLQQHLAGRGVSCAAPVDDRRGERYSMLNRRPAAIINRLDGAAETRPGVAHCVRIGQELARFHLAGLDYPGQRPNPRGIDWILAVRDMLEQELSADDRQLVDATLQDIGRFPLEALPRGAIHADLFHDNALFVVDELVGIIDFDYACSDSFAFDIAVLLNDWCIDADCELEPARMAATLDAYHRLRPLSRLERDALPRMLGIGALRFWMSRLYDRVFPLAGELTYSKSPDACRRLLLAHRANAARLQILFSSDIGA